MAQPGSISHGTGRPEDLLPCFMSELDALGAEDNVLGAIERRMSASDYFDSDDCLWDLETVMEMLDTYAPDGHYFGAHEGDGSDFGFWPAW